MKTIKKMTANEVRQRFLKFFESKGHKIIPSSFLIPENDPSVLFTTAGMQQFKKYYINPEQAEKDFGVKNVASVQKCVRTGDIDEVGDNSHLTFFEMLGNFSFGGYGRTEAIEYAHEFITKEMGLKIDYVSVFEDAESGIPADEESYEIWNKIDSKIKIKKHKKADNFWGPVSAEGPCGPTTEIYINGVEIWNIVFNEYYKNKEGKFEKLKQLGIDTGMGFERLVTVIQNKESVYDTDLFNGEKTKEERIVVDHLRASENLIADGVIPSNTGAGYVLRRLIRRAVRFSKGSLNTKNKEIIKEADRFRETLEKGMREFEKGVDPFILFTTYGFPIELTEELAKEKGVKIDLEDFNKKMEEHQKLSQTASAGMFKGGLADAGEETKRLHTATHLLNSALRQVLGNNIMQKGSNITAERLRFDFTHSGKMTDEEKKKVEEIVNDKIAEKLPVNFVEMAKVDAEKIATHSFNEKYGDRVKVYSIGDEKTGYFSREFCGGPHVENTGELGHFKILKEEAVAQGIRRIKAILE